MRRPFHVSLLFACLILLLPGCGHVARDAVAERPVVACSEPEPAEIEIVVRAGDTLHEIARRRYGNRCYYRPLAVYNHRDPEVPIEVDARFQSPALRQMLLDECGRPEYLPALEAIACAQVEYSRIDHDRNSHLRPVEEDAAELPDAVRQPLLDVAADVEIAIATLRQSEAHGDVRPFRAIRQLEDAKRLMMGLARGEAEIDVGKDSDFVEQRFALGMTYLILWARAGYR